MCKTVTTHNSLPLLIQNYITNKNWPLYIGQTLLIFHEQLLYKIKLPYNLYLNQEQ